MKLNGFQLKLIAAFLMLIDHIHQFIPGVPLYFNQIGRVVAPIFLFLAVEGFYHTRNRESYIKRLLVAGAFMFLGSKILVWAFPTSYGIPNNIFLSIGLSMAFLYGLERSKTEKEVLVPILLMGGSFFAITYAEGSQMVLLIVLVFYRFRGNIKALSIAYAALSVFIGLLLTDYQFSVDMWLYEHFQWMMVFSLPFIWSYNGAKGKGWKSFFYIFYPLHIWVLYFIGYGMNV